VRKYGPLYWIRPWLLCRDRSASARRCACFYVFRSAKKMTEDDISEKLPDPWLHISKNRVRDDMVKFAPTGAISSRSMVQKHPVLLSVLFCFFITNWCWSYSYWVYSIHSPLCFYKATGMWYLSLFNDHRIAQIIKKSRHESTKRLIRHRKIGEINIMAPMANLRTRVLSRFASRFIKSSGRNWYKCRLYATCHGYLIS